MHAITSLCDEKGLKKAITLESSTWFSTCFELLAVVSSNITCFIQQLVKIASRGPHIALPLHSNHLVNSQHDVLGLPLQFKASSHILGMPMFAGTCIFI